MLTLLTTLLLTAAFLGTLTGTVVNRLGASMPDEPDAGALLLGKILAGLGQTCAVTAAAALLRTHEAPSGPLAWLLIAAALAATASLATGRRGGTRTNGKHRAHRGNTIATTGAAS